MINAQEMLNISNSNSNKNIEKWIKKVLPSIEKECMKIAQTNKTNAILKIKTYDNVNEKIIALSNKLFDLNYSVVIKYCDQKHLICMNIYWDYQRHYIII